MRKLKEKFQEDPFFAVIVLVTAATVATGLLRGTAKVIESSAYAYRASKL